MSDCVKEYLISLYFLLIAGFGQDPFGAGGPFQGMNADDIFKSFFGDRAGGFSSAMGMEDARATQVGSLCKAYCVQINS